MTSLGFPKGEFQVWADDDDVIGLTVAKSYPSGWPIMLMPPAGMNAFDEYEVASFLARCLTHHGQIKTLLATLESADG